MDPTSKGGALSQRKTEALEKLPGGGFRVRVSLGAFGRHRIVVKYCTESEAEKRRDAMVDAGRLLVAAGHGARAKGLLDDMGAAPNAADFRELIQIAEGMCRGKVKAKKAPGGGMTFREVAEDWTSGRLQTRFPDHVRAKDHDADKRRLEKLCAIDIGGKNLGDVTIGAFSVDHAEKAMGSLPEGAKRSATRRHYAQVIHRVLGLAVYPLRLIPANPLPRGFLPKIGKSRTHAYLYPDEDAKLLGSMTVALEERLLFGFLAREGLRLGEALALRWRDIDLQRGAIKLDENKTDDPRAWALDPGVTAALAAYKVRRGDDAEPKALVFVDTNGGAYESTKLASRFRTALAEAKVDRPELTEKSANRAPIRLHDLRGTFVTLSLANGRTETWVADRTGHRSSVMINRYRRQARQASEIGLGALASLVEAVPEFGSTPTPAAGGGQGWPQGRPEDDTAPWRNGRRRGFKIPSQKWRPGSTPGGATAWIR